MDNPCKFDEDGILPSTLQKYLIENKISQSSFCYTFGLHKGNFSQWLKGSKHYTMAINAAIRFLKEPIIKSKVPKGILPERVYVQGVVHRLYIIDGDQFTKQIRDRYNEIECISKSIHMVVCYANHIHGHFKELPEIESLTFIPSICNSREAADVTISMESMGFHMILPIDIEFIIVTKDVFAKELTARLKHYGRKASWIKELTLE